MHWTNGIFLATLILMAGCDGNGNVETQTAPADSPPETSESVATERPKSPEGRVIYRGPAHLSGEASLAYLTPGVYANVFPLDFTGERPANPLEVPRETAARLRNITPEIRMWSPPPGTSIAIERRGWQQGDVISNESCHIYFDYRVDVKEINAGRNAKFGQAGIAIRWIRIFPPPTGQTGMYVLIVTEVGINVDRIGEDFTETNTAVVSERQNAGQGITTTITREFIVEHELAHAEQIREAYYNALTARVRTDSLCRPTRPTSQHRARLIDDFDQAWSGLESSGAGGNHSNDQYPNTPVETEARRAAWRNVQ